ncbi:MAG TPA: HAMP domain-containing sensor histidine kinase [Thermoleophilaceae bacterium]|nr:HAMP domain-containing sensor histidine kinase [Thermoleophilaceae bacterium]
MRRIRSLGNKVALLFFLITAAAFGVIYFWVVTQPESSLEERRLRDLELVADASRFSLDQLQAGQIEPRELEREVRSLAEFTASQVTLLAVRENPEGRQLDRRGLRFYRRTDSGPQLNYPGAYDLARRAARTGEQQSAFSSFQDDDIGLVAQPVPQRNPRWVAIFSRDFREVAETVSFIRDRVLWATGAALLIALVGGWVVARRLAGRVQRVERAAAAVARGRFQEPLPVDSEDELGQLTRTFNDMQSQLREVEIARKEFIATASHELRTPIFSLAGFVELLQDEDLDAETRREFIDTMSEQVARLQKLSVDLLDLSRLDSGAMELQPEHVDLAELTRSVVGEFRPALSDHGTNVLMQVPDAGPLAHCDRERVAQIMRILLDNALRHTPEGTDVTVSAHRDNGAAALTVADFGPGLPPGSREKAFERFYTGDAARGAGLGLAIARELAERMDGRLMLDGGDRSTAFVLRLPSGGNDS